ncbi:hypothetical protein HPB51_010761 [Rhipicephalus microplus]|uniref:Cystine transporter cystinosin n=1 Tax=Rhipicephalus microplus TaxID=6941 RepID=A0A9J6DTY8_RHIMP|nr:hypothetical protein HPB51_010761 [Rhipicephalus microplus]
MHRGSQLTRRSRAQPPSLPACSTRSARRQEPPEPFLVKHENNTVKSVPAHRRDGNVPAAVLLPTDGDTSRASNESVEVHAAVKEGCSAVTLPGPPWIPLVGTEPAWINVTAVGAGHATVTLNTSLPNVSTADSFVHVEVFKLAWLEILSDVVGWIYFLAWSVSFYPQIYLNWKRKCVEGLSFDFVGLNLTGFLAYSFFNLGMYFSRVVQVGSAVVETSVNELLVTPYNVTYTLRSFWTRMDCSCFVYRNNNRVSLPARLLLAVVWAGTAIFGVVTLAAGNHWRTPWLLYLYYFSYCKLVITLTKYLPQAYLNYVRKSTIGWSIGNILLDFTGGSLSLLQMVIIAYNYDDWTSLFGNVVKVGLSLISMAFDVLFILQHYVLYRNASVQLPDQENS